ncbi:hypothetical protein TrST_g3345 [Triparma strigata]|uniref:Uncharacterized protein n=1 Tax=Triparma strigata TaxID=1606541 RepID=A0A9W7BEZ7_9STRA|nr:hypothetical protein TrST_g3345 [Triparma strigata]
MPPYGVSIVNLINTRAKSDEQARALSFKYFSTVIASIHVFDIGCALALVLISCSGDSEFSKESSFSCVKNEALRGFGTDNARVGDFFFLAVLRLLLNPLLLYFGIKWGAASGKSLCEVGCCVVAGGKRRMGASHGSADSLYTPLTEAEDGLEADSSALLSPTDKLSESTEENIAAKAAEAAMPTKRSTNWTNPKFTKRLVLMMIFVSSTSIQVYTGLKVSSFNFDGVSAWFAPLMCLTVLWINGITYLSRTLLEEMTRQSGLFLPSVHRHPVFFESTLAFHWCDLCSVRINGKDGAWRCKLCDFDMCTVCAARKDSAIVSENMLRSDKGVKQESDIDNATYFKRALGIAGNEKYLLMLSFFLLTLYCLTSLALPDFQGRIIDKVVIDEDGDYDKDGFMENVKIYLFIMLSQGALSTVYSAAFNLVSRRLVFHIRNTLFRKIVIQDVAYFDGTESGRLISRLTNDVNMMMAPIQSSLSSLLNNIFMLFGGVIFCYIKSYRLSMLAFVTVGPIMYLWDLYANWSKRLNRQMLASWAEGNSIASQSLSHIRTVKAFGTEEMEIKEYTAANKEALRAGVKDAWGNGFTTALTSYLDLGTGVLILYYGGLLVMDGEMSVGELVTFQLYWNMMNNAYQNLQSLVTSFTRSAAGAEKVFSLWDATPDINPNVGDDVRWDVKGDIVLKNVKFFYQMRPDNIVLGGLNLHIPSGKVVALVGRSGGGKSTIINMLMRFYDCKEGSISLDGRNYEGLKVSQLRKLFGVVSQETELFAKTVAENICYGMEEGTYTQQDIEEAAKQAQAHDFIMEMKDAYKTRVGERGSRISGGQRQRLAIARVFLRKPKIILLDEATSALDENSQEAVQEALNLLISKSNATVVLVAHRLSTVMNADKIAVIDKGAVLEEGTHDELVKLGGIYATLVSKQNKKKASLLNQKGADEMEGSDEKGKGKGKGFDDIDSLLASK